MRYGKTVVDYLELFLVGIDVQVYDVGMWRDGIMVVKMMKIVIRDLYNLVVVVVDDDVVGNETPKMIHRLIVVSFRLGVELALLVGLVLYDFFDVVGVVVEVFVLRLGCFGFARRNVFPSRFQLLSPHKLNAFSTVLPTTH